jgi:hypothetical protein
VITCTTMERLGKNQTIVLMFLLMVSTVLVDGFLESTVSEPVRTSAIAFSLFMGMFWTLEQRGLAKWPKSTLARKVTRAAMAAIVPPLFLHFVG